MMCLRACGFTKNTAVEAAMVFVVILSFRILSLDPSTTTTPLSVSLSLHRVENIGKKEEVKNMNLNEATDNNKASSRKYDVVHKYS